MNVAVVEDNPDLRAELEYLLSRAGFQVKSMSSAEALYQYLDQKPCLDIVILDLGLPGEDGLQVAEKLKGKPGLGIIMLTARGDLQDRIKGLECGADVYLTKPIDVSELIAVMESIYRRLQTEKMSAVVDVRSDQFCLDESGRTLFLPDGREVLLTRSEGTVLQILSRHGVNPVSRKELSEALGQDYMQYDERRLEAIISRLRKKLKNEYPDREIVKAARGMGYQLLFAIKEKTALS